jgi:sulfur carrier protein ThiS
MKITVKLLATYRKLLPPEADGNKIELKVPAETSISAVLAKFDLPQEESSVILLNGTITSPETVLQNGDRVTVFSAVAGG